MVLFLLSSVGLGWVYCGFGFGFLVLTVWWVDWLCFCVWFVCGLFWWWVWDLIWLGGFVLVTLLVYGGLVCVFCWWVVNVLIDD